MENIFKDGFFDLIPRINNIYFFDRFDIFPGKAVAEETKAVKSKIRDPKEYETFLNQKARRPVFDIYASFQPFNEASKALYPFLKKLQTEVKKGDTILNLWDRSGWFTTLLAGLFPDQHIITTWDGNRDVLGYNGFIYWMKEHKNVSVVFCDLNSPLPFKENSINFSIGLDTLHRFDQSVFLSELDRVTVPNGAIIFPHVHMANSEPDPFFERGGKQIHGLDYQNAFELFYTQKNRDAYIFSEPQLFIENDIACNSSITLTSTPNTEDYNGLIALLPESWRNATLSAYSFKDIENISEARVIVNQLPNIDLHQQLVTIDKKEKDSTVNYLLDRHPIYEERINELHNYQLTELAAKIIYLAKQCLSILEISNTLEKNIDAIVNELGKLEKTGLVQVLPISESGVRLQNYLMTQQFTIPKDKQNLKSLWESAVAKFADNIAIIAQQDESEFTYSDCNDILETITNGLRASGLKKGDKIVICSKQHVESVLLYWACMQMGIVVVPIGTQLSTNNISFILEFSQAKFCFTNADFFKAHRSLFTNIKTIYFDSENEEEDGNSFSEWLEQEEIEQDNKTEIKSTDPAVIIFTSGSTGTPKGVELSHGNLYRSGRLVSENFQWEENDRYYALGGLESMSGLRNSAICSLHTGSSVIIPNENTNGNLFAIVESIALNNATLMGSNPALLRQFVKYKSKIGNQLSSIKTLICTGNKLTDELRESFKKSYNLPIYNYYGLSETTGICITQSLAEEPSTNSIGKPIECIAQIVDEEGAIVPINKEGELRIYSENLMQSYYNQRELTDKTIVNGWFYTQDAAKFNSDGNIELLGRKRNIIKTATEEIVYLDEIQEHIRQFNSIDDNVVCSFEKDDSEKIAAFIQLNKAVSIQEEVVKKEIRASIINELGKEKNPHQIIFMQELPYSDNGKILKNKLLDELQ